MSQRDIRGWTPLAVPGRPKVSVAVATFDQDGQLACLLASFMAQSYDNWEAVVVHDGPGPVARRVVERFGDPRVRPIETPARKGQFGHPWRELGEDAEPGLGVRREVATKVRGRAVPGQARPATAGPESLRVGGRPEYHAWDLAAFRS